MGGGRGERKESADRDYINIYIFFNGFDYLL